MFWRNVWKKRRALLVSATKIVSVAMFFILAYGALLAVAVGIKMTLLVAGVCVAIFPVGIVIFAIIERIAVSGDQRVHGCPKCSSGWILTSPRHTRIEDDCSENATVVFRKVRFKFCYSCGYFQLLSNERKRTTWAQEMREEQDKIMRGMALSSAL